MYWNKCIIFRILFFWNKRFTTIICITSVLKIEQTGHQIIIKMGLEFMEKYAKMCVIHILPFILTNKHLSVCCKENSWSACRITSGGNVLLKRWEVGKRDRKILLFLVTTDDPSSDVLVYFYFSWQLGIKRDISDITLKLVQLSTY